MFGKGNYSCEIVGKVEDCVHKKRGVKIPRIIIQLSCFCFFFFRFSLFIFHSQYQHHHSRCLVVVVRTFQEFLHSYMASLVRSATSLTGRPFSNVYQDLCRIVYAKVHCHLRVMGSSCKLLHSPVLKESMSTWKLYFLEWRRQNRIYNNFILFYCSINTIGERFGVHINLAKTKFMMFSRTTYNKITLPIHGV